MLIIFLFLLQMESPPVGVEIFRSEKGLNANALYGVLTDPNGFVWVHTDNGLYRYDGHTFRVAPSTAGREVILASIVDSITIAALSFDNSIDLIDIRKLSSSRILEIPDSIKLNSFASTVRRFGDTLYVGTSERYLIRHVGNEWDVYYLNYANRIVSRVTLVTQTNSGVLIATSVGSWLLKSDVLTHRDSTIQLTSKPTFWNGKWWISGRNNVYGSNDNGFRQLVSLSELGIKGLVNQVL